MRVLTIGALTIASALYAQQGVPQQEQQRKAEYVGEESTASDAFITAAADPSRIWIAMLGKVQSIKAGQQITINVDNGQDKTFDLAEATLTENVAVGDRVVILASKQNGGPVMISRDAGAEAVHIR